MADLYRKSSIEKLSNPDQLDKAITVSSPMSWIALLGVAIIVIATIIWSFLGTLVTTQSVTGIVVNPDSVCAYYSDYYGTVTKIFKKPGDSVDVNDDLMVIQLSDMSEVIIKADVSGKLTDYLVNVNEKITPGTEIARYTPSVKEGQVIVCYVPVYIAKQLEIGMKTLVYPNSVDTQKYGHMEAVVENIGKYAATANNLAYVLGTDNMIAEQFVSNGPIVAVVCRIKTDDTTDSGYYWSSENGKDITISNGSFVTAKIITEETAPIYKLFVNIKKKMEG